MRQRPLSYYDQVVVHSPSPYTSRSLCTHVLSVAMRSIPLSNQTAQPSKGPLDHTPLGLYHHCCISDQRWRYRCGCAPEYESQTPDFPAPVAHQDRRESERFGSNRSSCTLPSLQTQEGDHCTFLTEPGLRIACYGLIVNKLSLFIIISTNQ